MLLIGLCGKPSSGKSTFFSAATLVDVAIADYPFTTIDANKGVTYVRAACPHVELNVKCNPKNSKCVDGTRLIPTALIDVAGLVPGAHEGKGLGNKFLDDLRTADALVQIVDASGRTDAEGKKCEHYDPVEEVRFLEKEIDYWIASIMTRSWSKIKSRGWEEVANVLTGLKITPKQVEQTMEKLGLAKEKINWSKEEIVDFAKEIRILSKPIIIAANKIDVPGAYENYLRLKEEFPEKKVFPCYADGELALRKANEKGIIKYVPGDAGFQVLNANEGQQKALEKIRETMDKIGGTGVQALINEAAFNVLELIPVYPVEDENKYANHFGQVLPDAFLVSRGSTAVDLAGAIHTDLAKNFICAVNARTKMKVGKGYELKPNDVIKIVAGK